MTRHILKGLLVFFVTLTTTTCGTPGNQAEIVTTPIESIEWDPDESGFLRYKTNDPTKLNTGQFIRFGSSFESIMNTVEVSLKKLSGNAGYGFGVIFCSPDSHDFCRVLISTNGHYLVSKKVAGTYYPMQEWADAPLNTGLGAENVIKVEYDALHYEYIVFFNGVSTYRCSDTFISPEKVCAGFYVSIGSATEEDFPDASVDVRFRMSLPVSVP